MYEYMSTFLENLSDDEAMMYINSIMDDNAIYLAIEPVSENMTIDKLEKIYDKFPWIKPTNIYMPVVDSMGNVRHVKSRRPIVYGYLYYYRLKQYAEEKFSVTSLSSTNIKNENTRNKASSNYKALYPRTPIRFGEMEMGNFSHIGSDLASQILMIYSTSPLARRLCSEIETGDPFNIDVKLDMDSKNRNAEILNVRLKTKGLRLRFVKRKKIKVHPIMIDPIGFLEKPGALIEPIKIVPPGEKFDVDKHIERLLDEKNHPYPIVIDPLLFYPDVEEDEDPNK